MQSIRECSVVSCGRDYEAKGYCHSHYEALRRNGQRPTVAYPKTVEERFMRRVDKSPSGHWMWTGSTASQGRYGVFFKGGKNMPAHRAAWEIWQGAIPEGHVIDHLCRQTLCVRPEHLEPKTQQMNILAGTAPAALNAAKTHCHKGHAFTIDNTRVTPGGRRVCRACARGRSARQRKEG